jgi:hypothetical protein
MVALTAACGTTATPAPQATPTRVEALIGDAACDTDAQCRTVGIGLKPCGGPAAYRAWSTLRTDEKTLQAAVTAQADTQRREQIIEGRVSTCEVVPDPGAYCDKRQPASGHAGVCRLNENRGAGGALVR